ncbi:hypothetical protein ACIQ4I_11810 [Rummeliibacillus sp. NPDC094406]|uniref:hypothetical protein n=1 Tax=Rummeliibacillus sp. NPDC094406 TaxID=3364511 RepID=UPI003825CF5B
MKLKKSIIFVAMIVLLIVGIFAFNSYKKASKLNDATLTIRDLKQQNFLKKQEAVLYASSTTEVLQKGKGDSLVIFIDHQGNARGLKLSGLEDGSTYFNTDELLIEESNRLMLLGDKLNIYDIPSEELRGIQTGYLSKTKQFYSLYNTGFSTKHDYKTVIRFGEEGDFHISQVPHFVSSVGQLSDRIIVLTQDLITGEFALQEVQLKKEAKTKKLLDLPLENAADLDALTPVVADKHNFYFVMSNYQAENREDLELVIVNRETNKVKTKSFIKYRAEDQVTNALPYNFNHSAYVNDGHFYYVNGLGEVFEYRDATEKTQKILQLQHEKKGNRRFEQITFNNNQIYYMYSNEDREFFLETYDLQSKKKIKVQEIKNLESILPMDDKNYFLTSLEIL